MSILSQQKLTKSEILILSSFRKFSRFSNATLKNTNSFFKKTITKILLLILTLLFVSTVVFFFIKSRDLKKESDLLYNNIQYGQALEKYNEAEYWWVFEKISPMLKDKDLEAKIQKANVMVRSTENYQKGKTAFDNGEYSSAKRYFNLMAENDPRKEELKELITKIDNEIAKEIVVQKPQEEKINPVRAPTTSTPTSIPITEKVSSYGDLHCPVITMVKDSLGNTGKDSIRGTFQKGSISTITIEIAAKDPQGLHLYFEYLTDDVAPGTGTRDTDQLKYTFDVTNAYFGPRSGWIRVDNRDGYGCIGAYYDTQAYFQYTVTP